MNEIKKNVKKNVLNSFRFLALSGCIEAGVTVIYNAVFGVVVTESNTPYAAAVTPWVNGLSIIIGIVLICNPRLFLLFYAVLFVQSLYLVFTGVEVAGIFVYAFLNMLLFCKGFFKTYFKLKVSLSLGIWGLVIFSLIFFGWNRVLFGVTRSLFIFSMHVCMYNLLKDQLSGLLPDIDLDRKKSACALPEPGSYLRLRELGLTERQCGCIEACLKGSSYKELGERYYVSESAIKKEMTNLYRFFGVKNREMLRLLLVQYKIGIRGG